MSHRSYHTDPSHADPYPIVCVSGPGCSTPNTPFFSDEGSRSELRRKYQADRYSQNCLRDDHYRGNYGYGDRGNCGYGDRDNYGHGDRGNYDHGDLYTNRDERNKTKKAKFNPPSTNFQTSYGRITKKCIGYGFIDAIPSNNVTTYFKCNDSDFTEGSAVAFTMEVYPDGKQFAKDVRAIRETERDRVTHIRHTAVVTKIFPKYAFATEEKAGKSSVFIPQRELSNIDVGNRISYVQSMGNKGLIANDVTSIPFALIFTELPGEIETDNLRRYYDIFRDWFCIRIHNIYESGGNVVFAFNNKADIDYAEEKLQIENSRGSYYFGFVRE